MIAASPSHLSPGTRLPALLAAFPLGLLLLFFFAFTAPLAAQPTTWRTAVIGGGGFVTGTIFHPSEPGLVYARTDVGGIYRLDPATNRWIALNDDIGGLNNEFQHLGVLSLALDPNDPDRVFIATGQYGGTESWKLPSRIYRSSDRGATWDGFVTPGFKMAGNGEGRGTGERFAVSPDNGSVLLLGTSDSGVWRSTDRGLTWARLNNFPTAITGLNFVLFAPANASGPGPARRVYAAGRTLSTSSLWQSDDHGDTWTAVPNQPGRTPGQEMFPLMGSFDAAGTFFVTWGDQTGPSTFSSRSSISRLPAGSSTWTTITPPTGQGGFAGISADPRVPDHVVATTLHRWWPADEVYRSTNGGSSWSPVLRSTGTTRDTSSAPWASVATPHWMTDIDIDPFDSNRVIFNTGFGLFQTTNLTAANASRVWTFFNHGLEELVPLALVSPSVGPPLVAAAFDYTGFRFDNLNRSPQRGAISPMNGSNNALAGAALASHRMVRQNSRDSLYSSNAGASWTRFPTTPLSAYNGHLRIVLSADGSTFLWAPTTSGAYVSTNNGASWTASTGGARLINTSATLTVSTLAGALGSPGSTNATGTSATFSSPEGVTLAADGRRYVADTANHTIRSIATGGVVGTLAGSPGLSGSTDATGSAARFQSPSGIVFANGALFVADTANHTIRRITPANVSNPGVVTTFAGSPGLPGSTDATGAAARFNSPRGLATDSAGNLYVADTANHTIRKITPAGVVSTLAGSPGSSGTTNATGAAARFNSPRGLAFNAAGDVFVADTANHAIRRITPDGIVTTFAGAAGTSGTTNHNTGTNARFNSPRGITIDSAGILHVADTGNHTIRRITATGSVTTVAGSPGATGTANGENTTARFNTPSALVTEPDGYNLYVADTANHGVRRASAYRTLTPVADAVNSSRLYLWSQAARTLLTSTDAGLSFSVTTTTLPTSFQQIRPVPGRTGHLWARAGGDGLYSSTNYGASWIKFPSVSAAHQFDFGRAAPGATHPAVFVWGTVGGVHGFHRSDNAGSTWSRINTDTQNFGYINDIAGDSRTYGRVFLGTSGRGVVVGELTANPTPQPSVLVYGDALGSGWSNTSTSGVSLGSTASTRRGTTAISVPAHTSSNTYAFATNTAARSTVGLAALSFWVSAGDSAPPPLRVGSSRGGYSLEAYPVPTPAGSGWQRVLVPLADLGIDHIDDLTGLRIEAYAVNGVLPGAFLLDDVALVGLTDFTTTPTIHFAGLNASFDGQPKSAVVTTTPAGRGLLVTYDGSPVPPSAIGTYALVATLLDPFSVGSASASFTIRDANASIQLGSLVAEADGTPKSPSVTTTPAGLTYVLTFDGSPTAPSLPGNYTVVATISDPLYAGSSTATFSIRQPAISATAVTGWRSPVAGKVSAADTAAPLFTPNDTTDGFSSNPLHARFNPIRLLNVGDTVTVTGSFQLTADGVANAASWFRFGLFDHQGQAPEVVTGWLGGASIGGNYFERTASAGLFTTGSGAASRAPDASPAPVSQTAPSGRPPVAFTLTVTRLVSGVLHGFELRRTDTGVVLLNYNYTDSSPSNNGTLNGQNNAAADYSPTYNTVGFAFARSYLGATPPQAQFSNISYAFTPGPTRTPQFITFAKPADRPLNSPSFTLSATASSGLPVVFSVVSGPATLSGSTLTLTGAGDITVRASQAGSLAFEPAPPIEHTFASTKLPASVVFTSLLAAHDGSPKLPAVATTPPGLAVTFTFDDAPSAPVAAGAYNAVATIDDPTYQGQASGVFVIEPGPQSLTFPAQPDRGVGVTFDPGATSSSGLPVVYSVVSGPATSDGAAVTITDLGPVVLRASQPGDANYLHASPVDRSFSGIVGTASVTLSDLAAAYDGQPRPVTVSTLPAGLAVTVTYAGSPTPPSALGSYAVVAIVNDPRYTGSASGTLVIAARAFPVTGWRTSAAHTTVIADAHTNAPLLNATNAIGTAGASVPFYAFFDPVTLATVGDSLRIVGTATVNTPAGTAGAGQWFRFGLHDNRDQAATVVTNWLGYTAMANATASGSLHEKIGNQSQGDFASGFFGTVSRTVDPSPAYVGEHSPSGVVTLRFEQTITRFAGHITVVSLLVRPGVEGAPDTVYSSSSYTDTTPNNNGLATGAQSTPLSPLHSPRFNAFGLVLPGGYINSTNSSSVQFADVEVVFTPGASLPVPVITFEPLADRPFSTTPIPLVASSSSGLPVTFSVVSGPATLEGASLTVTGVGPVTVRASQAATLSTLPAVPVERTFEVGKIPAVISLSDLTATFDGSPKPVGVTTNPAGLEVQVTYDGQSVPPSAAGTYSVTATIEDPLYEGEATGALVINQLTQSISFPPLPDRTFGDAPVTLAASSTSGLPVVFTVVSGPASLTDDSLALTGAGEVTVRASQPGDDAHAPAPEVERTFNVARAPATIHLGALAATFDGTPKAVTVSTSPAGLAVLVTYEGFTSPPVAAGSYLVSATITDPDHTGSALASLVISSPLVAPSTSLTFENNTYELRVPSLPGYLYQLQRSTDLSPGSWINLGPPRPGDGSTFLFTDDTEPELPRRFYRFVITPAANP